MDFLELAKERYSVRKFSDKKVEREKLDAILEAGRCAPTAVNYQPQRVLVLESPEALEKLKGCTPYHFHAPLALLVCYDREASWKRSFDNCDMGAVDAAIVTTQMMLEAASLGLGTTWVGYFDPAEVRKAYELPAADAAPAPFHEKRLAREETVFFDSFDGVKPGSREAGAH